jgi:hypothetical protein
LIDLPTVPVLKTEQTPVDRKQFETEILTLVTGRGTFEPFDVYENKETTMEGIVSRNAAGYEVNAFAQNVFKYVRKGHVKTDEHWTRNWKRAALINEGGKHVDL